MADTSIKGKTALVTGAAKRIGRAISLALAGEGVRVAAHYGTSAVEAADLVDVLRAKGVEAWSVQADLGDAAQAEALLEKAETLAGPVDIVINNAAIFPSGTLDELGAEDLFRNLQINALTPFQIGRALAARKRAGAVVNLLDARLNDYDRNHVAYHLSKRVLFSLTRMMALEFAPKIRVNAVAPGLILPPPGEDESYLEKLASTNPLNRCGTPQQIANAVLFLLKTDFVTGQVIFIDGGRHMKGDVYGA